MTSTTSSSTPTGRESRPTGVELPGLGEVPVRLGGRDRTRTFLLLHGGAGPASVAAFGDLLAERARARVLVPTHPGFDGTPRPEGLASVGDLARLYAAVLERLDVRDVTVVGNSIGGWVAAELALLGSPRVSGAVLVDAVGADVPGEPVADIRGLTPGELVALSFHDPARFAPDPGAGGPAPERVAANLSALFTYGGPAMTDPTLLDRLRGLDLPVHVVWGASDGIVTPANGRAIAGAVPGARFTLLPDAGHLPQIEAPGALLAALTGPG
jgi:pimeloyl-ACP methyl ester carboxylesterase